MRTCCLCTRVLLLAALPSACCLLLKQHIHGIRRTIERSMRVVQEVSGFMKVSHKVECAWSTCCRCDRQSACLLSLLKQLPTCLK